MYLTKVTKRFGLNSKFSFLDFYFKRELHDFFFYPKVIINVESNSSWIIIIEISLFLYRTMTDQIPYQVHLQQKQVIIDTKVQLTTSRIILYQDFPNKLPLRELWLPFLRWEIRPKIGNFLYMFHFLIQLLNHLIWTNEHELSGL